MRFAGFDKALLDFLGEMRKQDGDWFSQHQERFNELCVDAAEQFHSELSVELRTYDPPHYLRGDAPGIEAVTGSSLLLDPKQMPFMPYLHFRYAPTPRSWFQPELHFIISPGGVGFGAGLREFNAQGQRTLYRAALANSEKLDALLVALESAKEAGCFTEKAAFRYIPENYEINERNEKLIKLKGLIVRTRNEPSFDFLFDNTCVDEVGRRFRLLLPLQKWILENLSNELLPD